MDVKPGVPSTIISWWALNTRIGQVVTGVLGEFQVPAWTVGSKRSDLIGRYHRTTPSYIACDLRERFLRSEQIDQVQVVCTAQVNGLLRIRRGTNTNTNTQVLEYTRTRTEISDFSTES